MRNKVSSRRQICFLAIALLGHLGCAPSPGVDENSTGGAIQYPCLNPPSLTSDVPSDSPITNQESLNCFAWQEFIALNWPAAASGAGQPADVPASALGRPGDTAPVVWETYMDVHQLFRPDGSTPPEWGASPAVPASCRALTSEPTRTISRTSKVSIEFNAPDDLKQAFPSDTPRWLADRNGNPVLYEIFIGEDEYRYIVDNGYYNAQTQYEKVASGGHLDLPRGSGDTTGSIEVKSAWLVVPDPSVGDWNEKYKLSEALVYDEHDGSCSFETVALVGMHIIHKTASEPQWIWATFEHVDNAPDQAAVDAGTAGDGYTFYDPDCEPMPVPDACRILEVGMCRPSSNPPLQTSCTPNQPPAYCLDLHNEQCPAYPVQVTRRVAIADHGDNQTRQLNAAMQELIRRQAGADSIWQHYQLVGVLWSGSPFDANYPGSSPPLTPLSVSGIRPDLQARPLANTTMETFIQQKSCIVCHRHAQLAWSKQDPTLKQFAADYSFIFSNAGPRRPGSRD